MNKVWVVQPSGSYDEELFKDTDEAFNYAKQRSKRSLASFIYLGGPKKLFVYEHGEQVSGSRKKQISDQVEEMYMRSLENDVRSGRGKPSRKKV